MRALVARKDEDEAMVPKEAGCLDEASVLLSLASKNAAAISSLIDEHENTFGLGGGSSKQSRGRSGRNRSGQRVVRHSVGSS